MSGFIASGSYAAAATAAEKITAVNGAVNGFVWGLPMLILLVGTGILMTCLTRFFQITHVRHWFSKTIGAIFTDRHVTAHTGKDDKSISQFQTSQVWQPPSSRADPAPSFGCGWSPSSA